MLTGRRYLLEFTAEQEAYAQLVADACRMAWNVGLEQRQIYRRKGKFISYFEQSAQLTEARAEFDWLRAIPVDPVRQALRDLDRACREHGTWKVHWRSKARWNPSFRCPDGRSIRVERLNKRWGRVTLPKMGWVKFRWTRAIGGQIHNATVSRDGGRWYVGFCVEDGLAEAAPNGRPPIGVDRGVKVAIATSDGDLRDRAFITLGEAKRLKRLQQQLARTERTSSRRKAVRAKISTLNRRVRDRRADFCAYNANRLTRDHGLVVLEDLKTTNMTRSAKGTAEAPGRNVKQKAGLNRSILDKGWHDFERRCEYKARVNGSRVIKVNPAYTSQTCNACGHRAPENRESQAVFRCVACKHQAHADVNAAKNILAAGLAVTGRGDLCESTSMNRQPVLAKPPRAARLVTTTIKRWGS